MRSCRTNVSTDTLLQRLVRELRLWSKLDHVNVMKLNFFSIAAESGYPILITRFIKNGSLRGVLQNLDRNTDFNYLSVVSGALNRHLTSALCMVEARDYADHVS